MKETPLLMSGPMVLAILDGRKTQTRRVIKPQPTTHKRNDGGTSLIWLGNRGCHTDYSQGQRWMERRSPYGWVGDRLWVREAWKPCYDDGSGTMTRADCKDERITGWKPSIHMPRSRSRLTLEIVSVRVERLQKITEEDALAEGAAGDFKSNVANFLRLWDSINAEREGGKFAWAKGPWVWALTFRRLP